MIEISESEERTYKLYLETGKISKVMTYANRSRDGIVGQLERMTKLGLLQHDGNSYSPTGANYTVKKAAIPKPREKQTSPKKLKELEELIPSYVTQDQINYIRGHYGRIPRSKLAERIGMNKVDLNNTIIGLNLSKEKMEVEYEGDNSKSA